MDDVNIKTYKILVGIVFVIGFVVAILAGLKAHGEWSAKYQRIWQLPISIEIKPITYVKQREPLIVMSPVISEIEKPRGELNSVEQAILDKFPLEYGYIMIAIFRCESGLDPLAVNWTSGDVGLAQINWATWEKPIKEKFGYTIADMFDVDKNLDVALWVADRDGDGKDLDLTPWVVFNNGTFKNCIK